MRFEEAKKVFLSDENFNYLITRLNGLGSNVDKADCNSIFEIMKKMADDPSTFSNKKNLREVDEYVIKVIHNGLKKQKMYDYREEMTKRVISEDAPLHAQFVQKPIKIPTLLELVKKQDNELNPDSNFDKQSKMEFPENLQITNIFGMNFDQLLMKSRERSIPLIFDTRNRSLVDSDVYARQTISWAFFVGSHFEQGIAISTRTINNIISIRCSSLLIPNFVPELTNEFRQITMYIKEFSDQSATITSKTRAHFLFDVEPIGNRLRLTSPSGSKNEINFESPISSLNNLTISFASPFDIITLGIDRITQKITVNKSIGVGLPTGFTFTARHNLNNGDIIYLEGFKTENLIADNLIIVYANRDIGHIVSNVSDYYFEITTLDSFNTTGTLTTDAVIYGSKRFLVPLTFGCLSN